MSLSSFLRIAVTIGNTVATIFNTRAPALPTDSMTYTYNSGPKTIGGGKQLAVLSFSTKNIENTGYTLVVTTKNAAGTVTYNTFTQKFSGNVLSHLSQTFTWATEYIPAGKVVVEVTIAATFGPAFWLDENDYITMTFSSAI
jgi:hypothetical protein